MLNFLTTTTVCGFSLYHVLAFFLIYSCTGWCLEVIFAAATTGQLVNRGFLNGPVCPIYGFGMVIVLFTLTPLQGSVLLLYIGGVILPSALELVGGWALYKLYHTRWWDYSDFPFNIGGYICLEFSLLWGVGTLVVMRIVHPVVAGLVDMVPPFVGFVVMCVLYAVYAADVVVTAFAASGLAKTLDAMEQLADSIHAVSDAMTQLLGTTTLNADQKLDEQRLQLKLAAAEAREAAPEKRALRETLAAVRAKAEEAREAAKRASEIAKLNTAEAAKAAQLAAKGTMERAAELLRLEQLAEELQARSDEMQAQLLRPPPHRWPAPHAARLPRPEAWRKKDHPQGPAPWSCPPGKPRRRTEEKRLRHPQGCLRPLPKRPLHRNAAVFLCPAFRTRLVFRSFLPQCRNVLNIYFQRFKIVLYCFLKCHILSKTSNSEGFIMSEELKSNENVGALQPDALAQIASVDPSPAVGGMHPFTPAMLSRLKKQRQLLSELEHALKNHEFCFFLQPKCNSMTRAIVGMEALVRWNHPTRGCVPPSEFMPLLESTGLVTQLDQYIWESVCKTLHKWQESGSNLVPVSVNVSVVDIVNLDVPQIFSNLVEKYQLEPKLLLAEITETMLAENASLVENTIQGLHRKGFSVMMDDFGSGYSSLNMLKDTNVDAIKLDMKLIDMNQQNRSKGVQIVESVVDMAHRLNLPIIAEGVETPEQVSMLQAADCLYTQGYYFYKPMPVENAEALLAQPNSEDYWDMRRDLMCRDRRAPISDSEQTALALQAYQIFADNVLELSLLNLSTGEYRVIKRDPRLPGAGSDAEEDFAAYCERMVTNKVIHPDDAEMFTDQTDLETLRSAVFSTQQPEAYRFRKNVSGQFVWITMEFLPCRNCCAQNPWATVVVREDAQADHLSEELDFSYSHDTLTGLLNRSLFETDLRTLQSSEYDSMVCTYIDVVGLHEINNHLGHRSGDAMLCFIANAARKFFVSSRIYRIGGDEFVILTPNQPPYSVWVAVDKMRAFLRAKEYEISVGIQSTNDLHRLDDAMNQAEAAMRQDKQAYYARNGQERQLRGLNEKLEQTLTEKRDAEHFLRVLAPKYKSVFVVDLKTDRMRGVIVPDYFQKILDTSGGSFLAVLQQYRDTQVQPAYRESLADLLDYNYIRSKVLTGDIVEHTYKKTDDTTFRVKVTPYSRSGSHIDETLWIFSDEGASLTPPQTK